MKKLLFTSFVFALLCCNKPKTISNNNEIGCDLKSSIEKNDSILYVNLKNLTQVSKNYKIEKLDKNREKIHYEKDTFTIERNNSKVIIEYNLKTFQLNPKNDFQLKFLGIREYKNIVVIVFQLFGNNDCKLNIAVSFDKSLNKFRNTIEQWDFIDGK
jgi:hypothetical protein